MLIEYTGTDRSWFDALSPDQREELAAMPPDQRATLAYEWRLWARPKQLMPEGHWSGWLLMAGRGAGKTRAGAEWIRSMVETGRASRIALVAETAADCRDVLVEGESGIMAISPPWNRPVYESSKRRLTWPNGAIATLYNGTEPDQLRGPQHDCGWLDEVAKYRYAQETMDMFLFGLRLGADPRYLVTTTPRPIKLIRKMVKDPYIVVTSGSSLENLSNLSPTYRRNVIDKYAGTRLGRQEIDAELLEDTPGALWTASNIDDNRVAEPPCDMARIVVAIDPAAKSTEGSAESGLIVAGLGVDGIGYILEDLSFVGSPDAVVTAAVKAYRAYRADRVIAEVNNGGEWIEAVLRNIDRDVSYRALHASRGKITRAEPVAALYERGRVRHVGLSPALEDQMTTYSGAASERSPDRMDAMVWAITELMLQNTEVYDMPAEDFVVKPFHIPDDWPRVYAMSVTPGHTGVVWMAIDKTVSTAYLYTEFMRRKVDPAVSVAAVKARGVSTPGVMVSDKQSMKSDMEAMIATYQALGLSFAAGVTAGEADITHMANHLATGRLRVFSTMHTWLEQYRRFRREDGLGDSPLCLISAPLARLGGEVAKPVVKSRAAPAFRPIDVRAGY